MVIMLEGLSIKEPYKHTITATLTMLLLLLHIMLEKQIMREEKESMRQVTTNKEGLLSGKKLGEHLQNQVLLMMPLWEVHLEEVY